MNKIWKLVKIVKQITNATLQILILVSRFILTGCTRYFCCSRFTVGIVFLDLYFSKIENILKVRTWKVFKIKNIKTEQTVKNSGIEWQTHTQPTIICDKTKMVLWLLSHYCFRRTSNTPNDFITIRHTIQIAIFYQ